MAERLARVETTVGTLSKTVENLDRKFDQFVKTATSPEVGFVSGGYLAQSVAHSEREHLRLDKRIDDINIDHNHRLQVLEEARTRLGYWMAGVFGSVIIDVVLHMTGIKP